MTSTNLRWSALKLLLAAALVVWAHGLSAQNGGAAIIAVTLSA